MVNSVQLDALLHRVLLHSSSDFSVCLAMIAILSGPWTHRRGMDLLIGLEVYVENPVLWKEQYLECWRVRTWVGWLLKLPLLLAEDQNRWSGVVLEHWSHRQLTPYPRTQTSEVESHKDDQRRLLIAEIHSRIQHLASIIELVEFHIIPRQCHLPCILTSNKFETLNSDSITCTIQTSSISSSTCTHHSMDL